MAVSKSYHAFTDGLDEYVETYEQAEKIIDAWRKDGATNLRIYELTSEIGVDDEVHEDCVFAEGDFPW